ncbi:MAG TPA: phosphomannomutase/phosphoglucomutase, partial [Candidatus Eisenbacteria bacterium]|nr:phosphomannomutase/phosphoglucomutase [Candidatus Eisenbacteria bacterium]
DGAVSQGADVVDIGLASTDLLYFASGHLGLPGAMFTASHNPARYNGIKLCRAGAAPVGQDSGLAEIRTLAEQGVPAHDGPRGRVERRDLLPAYADYLRSLVDLSASRRLKVVVDAGNGMAGHTVPEVLDGLPVELVPMYFELDGTFPNHEANPLDPANLVDLQARVREVGADVGLAFDGDADRCFVVDERGEPVSPSAVTALVAARELAKEPGGTVIHNLITSRAVPEIVREHGGTAVRTRVGHSFIKQEMARTGAIFGGEHSAHYYFRDFWRADTGMLAALHVLAALAEQDGPLSALAAGYERYVASGEINSEVADQAGRMAAVREAFADRPGVETDDLDGLTVGADGWWFNLRASNTEPLLRLNVEAADAETMHGLRDEVLALVRKES